MKKLKALAFLTIGSIAALTIAGCDHGGGDSGGGGSGVSGPGPGSSFAGVIMTINPVITFVDNVTFTYRNDLGTDDIFPVTEGADFTGTYIYSTSGTYETGTLTLNFTSEDPDLDDIIMELDNFGVTTGNVTSARATVNGSIYNVTFSGAALEQGKLPDNGGEVTLPASVTGNEYTLAFVPGDNTPPEFPYEEGDLEIVVFDATGRLTIVGLGEDFGLPYLSDDFNNYYLYSTVDADVILAVVANNDGLSAIQIFGKETETELGIFIPVAP